MQLENFIKNELQSRTRKYRWFTLRLNPKNTDEFFTYSKNMYDEFLINKKVKCKSDWDKKTKTILDFNKILLQYTITQIYLQLSIEEKLKDEQLFERIKDLKEYTEGLIDLNPSIWKRIGTHINYFLNKFKFYIVIKY